MSCCFLADILFLTVNERKVAHEYGLRTWSRGEEDQVHTHTRLAAGNWQEAWNANCNERGAGKSFGKEMGNSIHGMPIKCC